MKPITVNILDGNNQVVQTADIELGGILNVPPIRVALVGPNGELIGEVAEPVGGRITIQVPGGFGIGEDNRDGSAVGPNPQTSTTSRPVAEPDAATTQMLARLQALENQYAKNSRPAEIELLGINQIKMGTVKLSRDAGRLVVESFDADGQPVDRTVYAEDQPAKMNLVARGR